MIQIEYTSVTGWAAAVRGMRNPHNSWYKSDSNFNAGFGSDGFIAGDTDLNLMRQLVKAGTDHSKFMRMITVTCDITAPLYWWKEIDTYKVGTVRNSCSTMHTITNREFTKDDFSTENVLADVDHCDYIIGRLNYARKRYLETEGQEQKSYWYSIIQLLPSSYNQRATWSANYAVLRNIYHARKKHKLDEWHDFCHWIETLPYSELITL